MSNPWTVAPEAVTKHLTWVDPDGVARPFWIKIKKFLSVGEERVVQTAGWKGVTGLAQGEGAPVGEAEIRIDWKSTSFARAATYLVDWSLEDDRQNRVPLTVNSLMALHTPLFELIEGAISDHVRDMAVLRQPTSTASEPAPTSA